MFKKLFIITLYAIILSTISTTDEEEEDDSSVSVVHQYDPQLAKLTKMRCTRRFSPGVCVEEVAPVWTFVFFEQNCTERLGCPNNYRMNRFRSYRMCIKQCRPLVGMYLKMVEAREKTVKVTSNDTLEDEGNANHTDDGNLREPYPTKPSTPASESDEIPINFDDLPQDLEDEGYFEGRRDTRFIEYKDTNVNEDIMLPDVDYVAGEIRSEFDLIRG